MFRFLIFAVFVGAVSCSFTFSLWPFNIGWNTNISEQNDELEKTIPYIASIMHNETYLCSGAIINERTILTGAKCLHRINMESIKIGVGFKYRKSQGTLISIKNWIIHEKFNSHNLDNDIAIVFLADNIQMEKGKIESISMSEYKSEIPTNGVEGQIGCWQYLDKNKPETEILKISSVPFVTAKVCSKLVMNEITPHNICAGKFDGSANECQEDAGSPLVVQEKLVGIVSWGNGCITFEEPVVYTKISEFRNWIDNKMRM